MDADLLKSALTEIVEDHTSYQTELGGIVADFGFALFDLTQKSNPMASLAAAHAEARAIFEAKKNELLLSASNEIAGTLSKEMLKTGEKGFSIDPELIFSELIGGNGAELRKYILNSFNWTAYFSSLLQSANGVKHGH